MVKQDSEEPKWIEMPSLPNNTSGLIDAEQDYHDLGERYPQAPVPVYSCLLYTSPSPRDRTRSRMPSSA